MLPSGGIYVERFKNIGIHTVECPFNKIDPFNFFHIKPLLTSLNPDIIHTHGRGAGLYVRSLPKRHAAARRVHTHHGFHLPESTPGNIVFTISEEYLLRNTDRIICVSRSESEIVEKTNPRSRSKIRVIPNVVDSESVRSAARSGANEFDSIVSLLPGKFVVTMIGRDDPVKNYPLAFSAAREVLKKDTDVIFLFIGIAQQNMLLNDLRHQYPDNIIAIPSMANPLPLLSQSSVLLITSKREAGAPLVMMEAACLGIPVVGVRVRGVSDGIHNEHNGLCVEYNSHSIAAALLLCAGDPELVKRLSKGALEYSQLFDATSWCEQYYAMYKDLL
ncbi:MAG: glycosyltransferase family 4 protein [Ignavibacteriales bacterium]|nr:glycosyltransferase family 4 protein [Ignavibacteriales bacterium]